MIKYDIENNFIHFLMFKKTKYCPNEEFFLSYQTTPHTFSWVSLRQNFKSSIKLIKQFSMKNAAIIVYDL
jgi:hypothetical protein